MARKSVVVCKIMVRLTILSVINVLLILCEVTLAWHFEKNYSGRKRRFLILACIFTTDKSLDQALACRLLDPKALSGPSIFSRKNTVKMSSTKSGNFAQA